MVMSTEPGAKPSSPQEEVDSPSIETGTDRFGAEPTASSKTESKDREDVEGADLYLESGDIWKTWRYLAGRWSGEEFFERDGYVLDFRVKDGERVVEYETFNKVRHVYESWEQLESNLETY